jgi:hypothetical protein
MELLRIWEHEGQVFQARVYGHESIFPHVEKHIDAMLATVKFLKRAPDPAPPEGFEVSELDGIEVWENGVPKSTVKDMVGQLLDAFEYLDDALPGPPRDLRKPRLIICKKDADYQQFAQIRNQGVGVDCAFLERQRRAIVASAVDHKKRKREFAELMVAQGASLRARHYFGGPAPTWLEISLALTAQSAHMTKGKPERPQSVDVKRAKYAVDERQSRLDEVFLLRHETLEPDDIAAANMEAWAWYHYLRYDDGALLHRPTLAKHISELRAKGDPLEARKVWADTDLGDLRTVFLKWAADDWK